MKNKGSILLLMLTLVLTTSAFADGPGLPPVRDPKPTPPPPRNLPTLYDGPGLPPIKGKLVIDGPGLPPLPDAVFEAKTNSGVLLADGPGLPPIRQKTMTLREV